ncbi:MAG: hypothetical protein ACN2B6_07995 [Rickettsiales bacterium]
MSSAKNIRAMDRKDFADGGYRDFISRKRGLSTKQVYSLCLAATVIVCGVTFLVYNDMMAGSILCVMVGTVLLITAKQDEKHKRQMQATEFLNALFASALGAGHKFCMIAKQDGEIVYLDRSFQQMFPDMVNQPRRTVQDLLGMYNASEANRETVLEAIKKDHETTINLQIEGSKEHTVHSIAMHMEPILRPSGFCLIRGRIA